MAFFTVEDRFGEMECVVFARAYSEMQHLIRVDTGVYVSGNISLREDEPPKLLVHRMETLVENNRFREEDFKKQTEKKQMDTVQKHPEQPKEEEKRTESVRASRLFLRVPGKDSLAFAKAENLALIFEGDFPTFFYYADEKKYESKPIGVYLDDYVLSQLKELLGEENVILK